LVVFSEKERFSGAHGDAPKVGGDAEGIEGGAKEIVIADGCTARCDQYIGLETFADLGLKGFHLVGYNGEKVWIAACFADLYGECMAVGFVNVGGAERFTDSSKLAATG
jgi:hypothetical protein